MLDGVIAFPPEYAQRYRARGYWQDKALATEALVKQAFANNPQIEQAVLNLKNNEITIKAENYVIEPKGDKKFIQVTRFNCSRPWLQALLTDFAQNRKVELPSWAAAAL